MLNKRIYTVGEITAHIKEIIEDACINDIWVEGEISNLREAIGNLYFDLKDERALLRCIMFQHCLPFSLKNGMKVIVKGDIRVYEKKGYYQLYAKEIKIGGVGELFMKFLELKEKLEKEGLFDEKLKKELPRIPSKIAIITSPDGAALQDMLNVLSRRFPISVVLAPVRVQGEGSAEEIERALNIINSRDDIDVIIIGRGGGSWEDLQPFNEENVARAIFSSKIPVISAVGHETDFTIADFVADKRAPTPSAAAEMAVPDRKELVEYIESNIKRLQKMVENKLTFYRNIVEGMMKRKTFLYPFELLLGKVERWENTFRRLKDAIKKYLNERKREIEVKEEIVKAFNPYAILERGYSICFRLKDNKVFSSIKDVEVGDDIKVIVKDGEAKCRVKEKK
ncbi:MAG: exodeoxyribonuclease VII large subunit [Thermoplasmata archaeon]|nr:MAG: exodeoxyribonuclease VII large subunit [Thermoplasmata archaeon]OYT61507.1 MAG: exodeoxyribonuclease VII large subunit [Thermoplasmatales archaeon ex4484_30]